MQSANVRGFVCLERNNRRKVHQWSQTGHDRQNKSPTTGGDFQRIVGKFFLLNIKWNTSNTWAVSSPLTEKPDAVWAELCHGLNCIWKFSLSRQLLMRLTCYLCCKHVYLFCTHVYLRCKHVYLCCKNVYLCWTHVYLCCTHVIYDGNMSKCDYHMQAPQVRNPRLLNNKWNLRNLCVCDVWCD